MTKQEIIFVVLLMLWCICMGVWLEARFHVSEVKVPSEAVCTVLGLLLGVSITRLYDGVMGD